MTIKINLKRLKCASIQQCTEFVRLTEVTGNRENPNYWMEVIVSFSPECAPSYICYLRLGC